MKKQAESWLNAAEDDLLVIKEIIDNEHLTHMVAFHAQQSIEKSIKAVLEEKEEDIPRIHNLIQLRGRIEKYIQLDIDEDIFNQINELYSDSRYPTDLGLLPDGKPTQEIAKEFNNLAQSICNKIKKYLEE